MTLTTCIAHAIQKDLDILEAYPEVQDLPVDRLEAVIERYVLTVQDAFDIVPFRTHEMAGLAQLQGPLVGCRSSWAATDAEPRLYFDAGAAIIAFVMIGKLLEARSQLANLVTYMDGKAGAEELIAKILNDPTLLKSLAHEPQAPGPGPGAAG